MLGQGLEESALAQHLDGQPSEHNLEMVAIASHQDIVLPQVLQGVLLADFLAELLVLLDLSLPADEPEILGELVEQLCDPVLDHAEVVVADVVFLAVHDLLEHGGALLLLQAQLLQRHQLDQSVDDPGLGQVVQLAVLDTLPAFLPDPVDVQPVNAFLDQLLDQVVAQPDLGVHAHVLLDQGPEDVVVD